jgi:hypothetical protein
MNAVQIGMWIITFGWRHCTYPFAKLHGVMLVVTCGYLSGLFGFLQVRNRAHITGLKGTKIINKLIINFGFWFVAVNINGQLN